LGEALQAEPVLQPLFEEVKHKETKCRLLEKKILKTWSCPV